MFSQNLEFQSFKSQFPKNNKDLSIISLDSLSVNFFEIMDGFFDEKIQKETKYKQITGSGLNFYKKCEKYLLERDKDIRYSENEVPEAIINYTFDKIELFIVKVNFREEIGGVSKIGVFTNQKGDILNVISLESAGFDIGCGYWNKFILDKNNLYLMKLDINHSMS